MSWLGVRVNAQALSRCGSCWRGMGVAPVRTAAPLCYNIRQASTTRPKEAHATKKAAKGASAAATKPKKTSTKAAAAAPVVEATKAARPAKKAQDSKAADVAPSAKEARTAAPARQKTRATKPAAAESTTGLPESAASPATTTTPAAGAAPTAYSASSSHRDPRQAVPPTTDGGAKSKADPSGPEYKQAARNWTATMIALPILIVTSYFLFERCEFYTTDLFGFTFGHGRVFAILELTRLYSGCGQESELGALSLPAPAGPTSRRDQDWRCLGYDKRIMNSQLGPSQGSN